jgi:dihydroxyacetone kinase-like protein
MRTLNASQLIGMIEAAAAHLHLHCDQLNALDSEVGDGDHGTALSSAFRNAVRRLHERQPQQPAEVFLITGATVMNSMGGASGALFGTFFIRISAAIGNQALLSAQDLRTGFQQGLEGVIMRGRAAEGDKTMVDALSPAVSAFDASADNLVAAFEAAAAAAHAGAEATAGMQARHGRARFAAERSVGHVDAGARSVSVLFAAFRDFCKGEANGQA